MPPAKLEFNFTFENKKKKLKLLYREHTGRGVGESTGTCVRNIKGEIGEVYIFPFNTYYVV